jgi:hypothetical protein
MEEEIERQNMLLQQKRKLWEARIAALKMEFETEQAGIQRAIVAERFKHESMLKTRQTMAASRKATEEAIAAGNKDKKDGTQIRTKK